MIVVIIIDRGKKYFQAKNQRELGDGKLINILKIH